MILIKKIAVILFLLVSGLIAFGLLPKDLSQRLTRALVFIILFGFAVRVGTYFFQ